MTIGEIKELFSNFNLKLKKEASDDYILSKDDVINGTFFQRFVDTPYNVINGLHIHNNDICYVYKKIKGIEIECNDILSACVNDEIEVKTYLIFRLYRRDKYGNDEPITEDTKKVISVIYSIDNSEYFTLNKNKLSSKKGNNTNESVKTTLTACYYESGVRYTDTKVITLPPKKTAEWQIENESTSYITIDLPSHSISKDGGTIKCTVLRHYSKLYVLRNSCGEIIDSKIENDFIDDVTAESSISVTNKKGFSVYGNTINVEKQVINAKARETNVIAEYDNFTSYASLSQAKGAIPTHKYKLCFENNATTILCNLVLGSKDIEHNVPFISTVTTVVDGEDVKQQDNNNLKVINDSSWLDVTIDSSMTINIKATETNPSRDKSRTTNVIIKDRDDDNRQLKLVITQPPLQIEKTVYKTVISNNVHTYTSETIEYNNISVKILKTDIYEKGIFVETNPINEFAKYTYSTVSTNPDLFKIIGINRRGDDFVLSFKNESLKSYNDIITKTNIILLNDDGITTLYLSDPINVTILGNDITKVNYAFSFDDGQYIHDEKWDDEECDIRTIHIISKKLIQKGNSSDCVTENTPFRMYSENNDDSENMFIINKAINDITIKPLNINSSCTYIIEQLESGEKIRLNLTNKVIEKKIAMPLKVIVYTENNFDIYTDATAFIVVDDIELIHLSPCWISPNMETKYDVAYNGMINLSYGKHKIGIYNIITHNGSTLEVEKHTTTFKEIEINEGNKTIYLKIKI